jgi:hypothetical protein
MVAIIKMKGAYAVVQLSKIISKFRINLGGTKDTWIISDNLEELEEPQEQQQEDIIEVKNNPISISTALTSRNAENLFCGKVV